MASRFGWAGRISKARIAVRSAFAVWFYQRRAHPSGQAVCLLGLRKWRATFTSLALFVVWSVLGAVSPVLALLAISPFLCCAAAALRHITLFGARHPALPVQCSRDHVYVHSLASVQQGMGAQLIASVAGEADVKGWSLYLDASTPALVPYYERFGFVRVGTPGALRMWRPCRTAQPPQKGGQ